MTSPVQNANPEADAYRAEQTAREQEARMMAPASNDVRPIQWPFIAPPNRGDPDIPWPAANPPTGGSISPPAPPNMSMYNYFDYAFATSGGWVASPGLPPWMWPELFRTIPNRSPAEAEAASQMPHPVSADVPPTLQATGQTAPAQSEQAAQFGRPAAQQMQQPSTQPAQPIQGAAPAQPQAPAPGVPVRAPRPQRPTPPPQAPTARAGTTNPQTSPGAQNIPLQGGVRTQSGFSPPSSFGGGMRPIGGGDSDD